MTSAPDHNRAIAPIDAPIDPAYSGSDRELLVSFLDYYRVVLIRKASGLDREQLAARLGPSTLTIGGLLKHMAMVEDIWFQHRWLGEMPIEPWASVDWEATPDWEFDSSADDAPGALADLYLESIERSRAAIADCDDLDAVVESRGNTISLRWILIHMIEEYARHCGHADLLREAIDGATGD